MGDRRAKQRHDPVAHHLVDGTFEAVNGLHHVFEDRIKQLAGFLRVAVGKQLHRALEVGEEYGDLFALAFEGAPRRQDLFSEVFGCVGLQ
jgi:hypothetical protein